MNEKSNGEYLKYVKIMKTLFSKLLSLNINHKLEIIFIYKLNSLIIFSNYFLYSIFIKFNCQNLIYLIIIIY
jgi:hypothetical protein